MSTILVNNIKSYTGNTVTISGSNISVTGNTTLGDGAGGDTITINGSITASNNMTISGSIFPSVDNTYDLGSSAYQWNTLHATTASLARIEIKPGFANITVSGSTIFQDDVTIQGNTNFTTETTVVTIVTASFGEISSSILPDADNTYDLGSAALQWNVAHLTTASVAHIQSKAGGTVVVSGSLNPLNDDLHDLGSSATQWKDLYIDGIANIDHISAGTLTLDQDITAAAATDAAFYDINGKRVEVRSQLQTGVAADTGWTLELRNTSIAANSLIVANIIGGEGAIITGSVVSANVITASTASLNFFNTGEAIIDNAAFTASLAIF